jgi:shikimate kinase
MSRILITGMSGTGKSTVIGRLAALGHAAVDADTEEWSEWAVVRIPGTPPSSPPVRDWVWQEEPMRALLETPRGGPLFISGCAANQGRFYDRFDCIVLFSASAEVMLDRIARRTNNPFGKTAEEREKILRDLRAVEPMLRQGADLEIDTGTTPLDAVVATVLALGMG